MGVLWKLRYEPGFPAISSAPSVRVNIGVKFPQIDISDFCDRIGTRILSSEFISFLFVYQW